MDRSLHFTLRPLEDLRSFKSTLTRPAASPAKIPANGGTRGERKGMGVKCHSLGVSALKDSSVEKVRRRQSTVGKKTAGEGRGSSTPARSMAEKARRRHWELQ